MQLFIYVGTYENLDFAKEAIQENPGAIISPCPAGFMILRPAPNEPTKPLVAPPPPKAAPAPPPRRSTIVR